MAKRKSPPSLKRRGPSYEPKLVLYVFCEGEKTEPKYLKAFSAAWGNKLVKTIPFEAAGVPLTLIRAACDKKRELETRARKKGSDSFDENFQVWGVFDVDAHPNMEEAKQLAKAHQLHVAISNPCFDLWGLLHFRQHDGYIHRHDVQRALQQVMPKYDGSGSKTFDYDLMHPNYSFALSNAKALLLRRDQEGTPGGNPSTDVFQLLETIIENGRVLD